MLDANFFSNNRQSLLANFNLNSNQLALVPAHLKLQKKHDEAFAFEQDSNFYYLTGIREPGCLLVITAETEFLIAPKVDIHHQLWEGQQGFKELSATSGIAEIYDERQGWKILKRLVTDAEQVYLPSPYDSRLLKTYYRMLPNPARQLLTRRLRLLRPRLPLADLRPALTSLRMIKQPAEIESIKQAISITLESIKSVEDNLKSLPTERSVKALLEYEFLTRGAEGPGFSSIVASGSHAAQIHYGQTDNSKLDPHLLLLDIGASFDGYSADISRTLSPDGFTDRQSEIYQVVEAIQKYALSLLRPGVHLREYEEQVEQEVSRLTKHLNLSSHRTKKRSERIIPHAVSHHLGLDVHDVADYDRPLEPNMVLTVEPGIYIPEEGIGIRIEDDILITKDGNKNLSA